MGDIDLDKLFDKWKTNKDTQEGLREWKLKHLLVDENELLELLEENPEEFYQYELSPPFIIKHKDKLNWDIICYTQELSKEVFEECGDYLRWDLINMRSYQLLDDEIIKENKDKLDWNKICLHPVFDIEFLDMYPDYLNWSYVSSREDITEDFARKHADKLSWYSLLMANDFSLDFLKEHRKYITDHMYPVIPRDFRDDLFD